MNRFLTALLVTAAVAVISVLHFATPPEYVVYHQIYQRLYYIPLIFAAVQFGLRGGLAAAIIATLTYAPHILMSWQGQNYEYALNQYAEIAMFFVVGGVTGFLGDQKRQERERAEGFNRELQNAYAELQGMVGKLLQAERLSSLAEIASGVVHEVRNPLGAIKGAVEILEDGLPEDSPRREFGAIATSEVARIDKIIQDFFRIARPPKPSRAKSDVNEIVRTVVRLFTPQAAAQKVTFDESYGKAIGTLVIDAEQIEQVLINLVINALQLMPSGGVIRVATNRRGLGGTGAGESEADDDAAADSAAASSASASEGGVVEITVEDSAGGGIRAGDPDEIFNSFYTTRENGVGLGLSVARRIVLDHGGRITAENVPPSGARFTIALGGLGEEGGGGGGGSSGGGGGHDNPPVPIRATK